MLTGIITALITPFDNEGNINYKVLKNLVEIQINNKVDGLLLLGTTSECSSLTKEEQLKIVDFVYNMAYKKIKLIIGVGSNNTNEVISNCNSFSKYDIDAFLVITPYYNKPNESGMYQHFIEVANTVDKPIILYNVPKRTGCNLSIDNVRKLKNHPNIIGIKEATDDIHQLQNVILEQDDNFFVYGADDSLNYITLCMGAKGLMSVSSNVISDIIVKMYSAYINYGFIESRKLHENYLKLTNALFLETSPVMTKELFNYLGYNVGKTRLPLGSPSEDNVKKLIDCASILLNPR